MTFRIEVTRTAAKQLADLPTIDRKRVARRIDRLADNPRPMDAKKLEGAGNLWRIRVGDYRLVYQIQKKRLIVVIIRVGHRREVYRRL